MIVSFSDDNLYSFKFLNHSTACFDQAKIYNGTEFVVQRYDANVEDWFIVSLTLEIQILSFTFSIYNLNFCSTFFAKSSLFSFDLGQKTELFAFCKLFSLGCRGRPPLLVLRRW